MCQDRLGQKGSCGPGGPCGHLGAIGLTGESPIWEQNIIGKRNELYQACFEGLSSLNTGEMDELFMQIDTLIYKIIPVIIQNRSI